MRTLVGYFASPREFNMRPRETPRSASSIAGASSSPNDLVPQRDSRTYQASTTPGTVPANNESLEGSRPDWLVLYHSIVASFGAVPSAFTENTFFCLAS